ncbi:MAG TPA: hypothetical protein VF549_19090 [Solirubrobacteraceae bacterium]|jgi:PBP1b-binding outer membrane lipoprotein LpoB
MTRAAVLLLLALGLSGCGGDDSAGDQPPAESSSTPAATIASPEAYRLAKADLGGQPTDPEARRYDVELDRLAGVCTNPRGDLAALAETVVEGAAESNVKVRHLKVLRNVGLEIPDGERRDCAGSFRSYLLQLVGP